MSILLRADFSMRKCIAFTDEITRSSLSLSITKQEMIFTLINCLVAFVRSFGYNWAEVKSIMDEIYSKESG